MTDKTLILNFRPTKGAWKADDRRLRQYVCNFTMGTSKRQRRQTRIGIRSRNEG